MVKKNEEELLDTLAVIDGYIRKQNIRKLTEEEGHIFQKIRISTQKLLPEGAIKSMEAPDEKPLRYTWAFSQVSKGRALERFKVEYNKLHPVQKRCFLSLLHLPESVIKKMNIILWWNGLGLVENTTEQTGEKNGEDVFEVLVDYGVIVRVNFNSYPEISKCKIHPRVRPVSVRHKVKLSDGFSNHCKAVYIVGASYFNLGPQWMAKMEHLEVLKLGRWLHGSPKHVEVESEEFLKQLGNQKHLRHLSFCGISSKSVLPRSILKLESLETLDLKACHYLETLPDNIASLRNLRHLNLSQCYFSSNTPCRISDLAANSERLKRLSIHIGKGEVESLRELSSHEHLKISWGVSDTRYGDIPISLPSELKMLQLEGFPEKNFPEWLNIHSKLSRKFMSLSTIGGKLESMDILKYVYQYMGILARFQAFDS
ncbi:Disease resistance RPP13-like protein 4 [Glycine max]|nr:Disease resistance RPP13-like protein 4 [Glycine max]